MYQIVIVHRPLASKILKTKLIYTYESFTCEIFSCKMVSHCTVCVAVFVLASADFVSVAASVANFLEELGYQLACDDSQGDLTVAEQTKSILHSALPHITC